MSMNNVLPAWVFILEQEKKKSPEDYLAWLKAEGEKTLPRSVWLSQLYWVEDELERIEDESL